MLFVSSRLGAYIEESQGLGSGSCSSDSCDPIDSRRCVSAQNRHRIAALKMDREKRKKERQRE